MYHLRYQLYILLIINILFGQEIVQDKIIVKIAPDISRSDFSSSLDTSRYAIEKVLVRRLNIVSIKLKNDTIGGPLSAIKELENNPRMNRNGSNMKLNSLPWPQFHL